MRKEANCFSQICAEVPVMGTVSLIRLPFAIVQMQKMIKLFPAEIAEAQVLWMIRASPQDSILTTHDWIMSPLQGLNEYLILFCFYHNAALRGLC